LPRQKNKTPFRKKPQIIRWLSSNQNHLALVSLSGADIITRLEMIIAAAECSNRYSIFEKPALRGLQEK
jgi:hypothetical protein